MGRSYNVGDLEYWDATIREKVADFGLSHFPQEFELCDHFQMISFMAYSGMPSHYPHWSYGKAYERLKTFYDYGISGLPYEMVINSNPSIAYLMRDNSLALQILTIAHVYAHNDFFKNNFTFSHLRSDLVVETFKNHADRVRDYVEDPSIGKQKVEAVLDSAHALAMQCRRNPAIRKLDSAEQKEHALRGAEPAPDEFRAIHKRPEYRQPDLHKVPLEPEDDILLFIRDHNPRLSLWEKDLLTIVHEEAMYFLPQMETKIINEGWASYWHRTIMNSLDLPQDLHMEFLVRHSQVVRPIPGEINPYHLGLAVWDDIERRYDDPTLEEIEASGKPDRTGRDMMFQVREVDRDVSFLRRFLTEKLMRDMDLIQYESKNGALVVSKVSDQENWQDIKNSLLNNVGLGSVPIIRVVDADRGGTRTLAVRHEFDGRELLLDYADKTLQHVHQLWGRKVVLETKLNGENVALSYDGDEFTRAKIK